MKSQTIILMCLALAGLFSSEIVAQPTEQGGKEKMKAFDAWAGKWHGEGTIQMGPGEPKKTTVEETIEFKLDGMILLVEGIGRSPDLQTSENKIVHHALAILSYEQATNVYKFNTYLKDGKSAQAWFNIVKENNYQWGFDVPGGKIKYSITIHSGNLWNEVGEFSRDNGLTWMKYFEMNLKKEN